MGHKCFISFKKEDEAYKKVIQSWIDKDKVDMIDKSLDEPINSTNEEYIMQKIRKDYLSDSTVTIFLIGARSAESLGAYEQRFIKRELQASLYDGIGNSRNGILGVVLPQMYDSVYKGSYVCPFCGNTHYTVDIGFYTTINEFSKNYYLNSHNKCSYSEDDRYCVLVKWDDFRNNPNYYIEQAFNKRSQPIAKEVVVYPK